MAEVRLEAKSIGPSLTVNDVAASLQFYSEALGFAVDSRHEVDGVLQGVMFKAGAATLGISQDDFSKGRDRLKGIGVRFWIETAQDLHALAEQVKAAGHALDSEVQALPWGPLGFAVTDPDGYKVTVIQAA